MVSFPRAAQFCFVKFCVLAIITRSDSPDMTFWLVASIVLSLMYYWKHRELQKAKG